MKDGHCLPVSCLGHALGLCPRRGHWVVGRHSPQQAQARGALYGSSSVPCCSPGDNVLIVRHPLESARETSGSL